MIETILLLFVIALIIIPSITITYFFFMLTKAANEVKKNPKLYKKQT